jgi:hypothetical protein
MTNKIDTHIAEAKKRLLHQYRHSARISALIEILFGRPVQDLEDASWQLYDRLDIEKAQGAQLDNIGNIVGLSRIGWNDVLYRLLLKAKIGKNVSKGTFEDVISVWQLLAQAGRIQVVEIYPAQIDLYSDTPIDGEISGFVRKLMQGVVAAGVRVDFLAIIFSTTNAFGFESDDETVNGFGDHNDTDLGGELAYIQLTGEE